jgi:CRP/FNR family transcriptional regulator
MLKHSFHSSCYPIQLETDDVIFDTCRPAHFFYFLTSGSIRVSYLGLDREIFLYRVQPGEICILSVGKLLASSPDQVGAFSEQPGTIVAIPEALLIQFVQTSPLFCLYIIDCYTRRIGDLLELLDAVSFSRMNQRLAGLLLSKGIIIQATHSQLANELGTAREVISRILKGFENEGLVKLERGKVLIINRRDLEAIATFVGSSRH